MTNHEIHHGSIRFAKLVGTPVHLLSRVLRLHPKRGKIVLAVLIVFTGSGMACMHQDFIPHFIWDGIAYTIHGFGCAPLIERALTFFAVTD